MKNFILIISHKNSACAEFFYNTLTSHKNIQKVNFVTYDRIDRYFAQKSILSGYLKSPKYYCEILKSNHQLCFKPFLQHFKFFFIIDKPKNIIKNDQDINYYLLRLRRIYELIIKTNQKKVFFDKQVYDENTYKICKDFLELNSDFKLKIKKEENPQGYLENTKANDFYDKYKLKITKYLEK